MFAANAIAAVALVKPDPLIPVAKELHATPPPLVICEKVNPDTFGEIVAVGDAGHVIDVIPEYATVVCAKLSF
ncbi:MAG: hypothetical protein IPG01_02360 [Chitinophagaceae bacterium]|nr:hypothetical protein [Chitinophagaceae bacterium]